MVSYVWQSQTLVPMFQFDRSDMALRRGVSQVIDELADTFDDWELAAWFAAPNSWLEGAAPVDLIDTDPAGGPTSSAGRSIHYTRLEADPGRDYEVLPGSHRHSAFRGVEALKGLLRMSFAADPLKSRGDPSP
jgi:hypothetical protein